MVRLLTLMLFIAFLSSCGSDGGDIDVPPHVTEMAESISNICSTSTVNPDPFLPSTGPRFGALIMNSNGGLHKWTAKLAPSELPKSADDPYWVFCVGPQYKLGLSSCDYIGGSDVTRRWHVVNLKLIDPVTNLILSDVEIMGQAPEHCPSKARQSLKYIDGPKVSYSDLRQSQHFSITPRPDAIIPEPPSIVHLVADQDDTLIIRWPTVRSRDTYNQDFEINTTSNLYLAEEPGVTPENYLSLEGGRKVDGAISPFVVPNGNSSRLYITVTAENVDGESEGAIEASLVDRRQRRLAEIENLIAEAEQELADLDDEASYASGDIYSREVLQSKLDHMYSDDGYADYYRGEVSGYLDRNYVNEVTWRHQVQLLTASEYEVLEDWLPIAEDIAFLHRQRQIYLKHEEDILAAEQDAYDRLDQTGVFSIPYPTHTFNFKRSFLENKINNLLEEKGILENSSFVFNITP